MDDVTDRQTGNVHGHFFGDIAGGHDKLDLGAHDGQHSAALDTGGHVLTDKLDGNEQVDLGCAAQAHEIDMRRQILDHVTLHVTADHADVLVPFDLKVEK